MHIAIHVLIVALSIVALWKGADWAVESAARIARRLGIPELVIGLTVIAIGTSAPEFAVSIGAAIKGQADISLGNVVGSNIFNLGLILGFVLLFRGSATNRPLVWRDGMMLVLASLLLVVFLYDSVLQKWEGAVLIAVLISYLLVLLFSHHAPDSDGPAGEYRFIDIPTMLFGLGLIIAGAHFLVDSASVLARLAGVSEWVISMTIVALGTSLPEMSTSLIAILKGYYGISVGNLVGSDLFNLLGVLGVASVIRPLYTSPEGYTGVIMLSFFMVLLLIMMRTGWKLTRTEGAVLIALAVLRMAISLYH